MKLSYSLNGDEVQVLHEVYERFENLMEKSIILLFGIFNTHYNRSTLEVLPIYYIVQHVHHLPLHFG